MNSHSKLTISLLFVLPGCALNAVRTEYAASVSTQGQAVAEASAQFLDRVDEGRTKISVEMIAADPACAQSPALFRRSPDLSAVSSGWLCAYPGTSFASNASRLSLQPLAPDLEPTLDLIASLSAFSDALGKIVEAEVPDAAKPLTDALELARAAEGSLRALAGGKPIVPAIDDGRLTAITGFISFVGKLQGEGGKVKEIRALLSENPKGAELVIDALREHLELFNNEMQADAGLRSGISGALLRRAVDAKPPVSADTRRKAAETYYTLQQTSRSQARLYPALGDALNKLQEADADLRRVIVDNPSLSAKERRRIAEINRQRVIEALNHVTSVITAFRGI